LIVPKQNPIVQVTSWVKAVEEACGLRNAASVREMLTFNFAFEVPKSHKVWQKWMGNGWENSKMEQLEREVG